MCNTYQVLLTAMIFQFPREVEAQGEEHESQLPLLPQEVRSPHQGPGSRGLRPQGLHLQQGQLC